MGSIDNMDMSFPNLNTPPECEHEWEDRISSMSGHDCYCIKCHEEGERQDDGSVFWPTT